MYETFDHTADLGIRVRAGTLSRLYEEAAEALLSVIVADLSVIRPDRQFSFRIAGTRKDDLLLDWLNELLYMFTAERVLLRDFSVTMNTAGFDALAWGEKYTEGVHELGEEVKAITYHGLKVEQVADGWLAEVILDI